jgi:hypothetical protein
MSRLQSNATGGACSRETRRACAIGAKTPMPTRSPIGITRYPAGTMRRDDGFSREGFPSRSDVLREHLHILLVPRDIDQAILPERVRIDKNYTTIQNHVRDVMIAFKKQCDCRSSNAVLLQSHREGRTVLQKNPKRSQPSADTQRYSFLNMDVPRRVALYAARD